MRKGLTQTLLSLAAAAALIGSELAVAAENPRNTRSPADASSPSAAEAKADETTSKDDVATLKKQVVQQQEQIDQLLRAVEQLKKRMDELASAHPQEAPGTPGLGQVASLAPVLPAAASAVAVGPPPLSSLPDPGKAPATQDQIESYTKKVDQVDKAINALNKGLAGFKLSGDVRLRSDNTFRSSNSVAGPAQNVRVRYRVRLNVDKAVSDQIDTHVQLGSGTFNNPLTFDTDFAGANTRGALFLTEAWGAYHPNKHFDFRGGKMAGVFADNEQFLLDDDIRLNGFQEIARVPFQSSSLGKMTLEFRGGQYILTNPNVQVLPSASACAGATPPANCAYVSAGFAPGEKVPSTNLFDQGFAISASGEHWSHQFASNVQVWRNPNSLQLASTAGGFPLLVNGYYGLGLSGAVSGSGNGTTTKGGAILTAAHYQVGRISYRVDYKGLKTSRQNFPVYFLAQGARNFGGSFYNNAFEGAINVGETKKFGDLLFKYAFYYKQANSMISQLTDDDVGTGTGVNLRTHAVRIDLGLNKWMVWQNRIYIQDELAGNDPARHFFVPVQRGTGQQYRYQSQLQFTF